MIKLDLKQNAFHTLRHAIEHLACASKDDELSIGRQWEDDHGVVWEQEGHKYYLPVGLLSRRPAKYNLKFALLHLIQSCELLLKAHLVETKGPNSILEGKNGLRTITIHKALSLTKTSLNGLLTHQEFELLCKANDIRNQMQHHQLEYSENVLLKLCNEFLIICCFLSQ